MLHPKHRSWNASCLLDLYLLDCLSNINVNNLTLSCILQSIWRSSILLCPELLDANSLASHQGRDERKNNEEHFFIQAASLIFFFLFSLLQPPVVVRGLITAAAAPPDPEGADPTNAATNASSLVAQNKWGVLWNVVSFSDGYPGQGYGVPYFYLEELEPKGRYEINGTKAAFTVSEDPLGTCTTDTQNPKCMRTTLTGKLAWISLKNPEVKFAQVALFTKHPEMEGWPSNQNFQIYKLDLEDIFLVNEFGRPKQLTPKDYLKGPPM